MIQPGLRIGRYEVGDRLGTGGFGVVYLARDTELGRELAIKVLRPEYRTQPDVVSRFLKEARAAARIDHPGIILVFECGHIADTGTGADGSAYIAMELLRGRSLAAHVASRGRLAVADALLIARQIAVALAVAHGAGIVHRDLKPDNVFLLPDPLVRGGYRIKILDFGVAKLAEPREVGVHTHSQMMLGTPKYMAPEQGRAPADVDHRADIYTLGCMLFEMVTGTAPYAGPGTVELIVQHSTAPVPSPIALAPGVPPALDALITKMLAKEPDARPDSMLDIDGALAAIAEVTAAPARRTPRSPPRRRPEAPQLPPRLARVETAPAAAAPAGARPVVAARDRRGLAAIAIVAVIGLAAAIGWVALRRSPAAAVAPAEDAAVAAPPAGRADPARIRRECQRLVERRRWDEARACGKRLDGIDPALAARLVATATDEQINEQQLRRLDDELRKGHLDAANTLVKRIPDESVYKAEARRRYDAARRAQQPTAARPLLRD